jgi:hypothetical protein
MDVNCFGPDVFLYCGLTLVVHYVQCWMVANGFQYGDDIGECLYHRHEGVDIGLVEKPFQHTCLYHLQDCVVNGDYLAI